MLTLYVIIMMYRRRKANPLKESLFPERPTLFIGFNQLKALSMVSLVISVNAIADYLINKIVKQQQII